MQPQKTFQSYRIRSCLLQDVLRNLNKRRTAFGDKGRREPFAGAITQIKGAPLRIHNARGAVDDKPMQFLRSNRFPESLAQTVQEIEDERFLDLDFLMRALEPANSAHLEIGSSNPSDHRRDKESQKEESATSRRATLFRRRLVMKILF